jgi:hypothetical protein
MSLFGPKKLIRDSEWLRVYVSDDGKSYHYESKFIVDNLQVSAEAFKRRWPTLSPDEKHEFADAFSCHVPNSADHQQILGFLMQCGPEKIRDSIARVVPYYADRDAALEFLLRGLRAGGRPRSHYYQALEMVEDGRAIPILVEHYEEYRPLVAGRPQGRDSMGLWFDYLQCCKTLLTLTADQRYLADLKGAATAVPRWARPFASFLLGQAESK